MSTPRENGYDEDDGCRDCGHIDGHAHWCQDEMLRQVREKAWEEGWQAGAGWPQEFDNPYRS